MKLLTCVTNLGIVAACLQGPAASRAAGGDSRIQVPFQGLKAVRGTHLYCRLIGQGDPLVVVHGGPGLGHDYLLEPFSTLVGSCRMLFYDQRGSGLSDAFGNEEKATMDDMVEDLEEVRKAFGLERTDLLGQSWGALIAISYAARYPGRVRSLTLLEPAPGSAEFMGPFVAALRSRMPPADRARLAVLEADPELGARPERYRELMAIQFKANFWDARRFDPRRFAYIDAGRAAKGLASSRMFGSYWSSFSVEKAMEGVHCPTLLLRGEHDCVPMAAFERMKALLPRAEAVVLKDAGHFAHIEQPEAYFKAIRRFLAARQGSAGPSGRQAQP